MGWCFLCPAFVAMRPGFQGLLLQHTGCPANSGMFTVSIFYRDTPQWPSYVWGCEWFMQGLGCLKKKKKRLFISIYSKSQMQIANGNTLRQSFSISKRLVLECQVQESRKRIGFVGLCILRGWRAGHIADIHLNSCNE